MIVKYISQKLLSRSKIALGQNFAAEFCPIRQHFDVGHLHVYVHVVKEVASFLGALSINGRGK